MSRATNRQDFINAVRKHAGKRLTMEEQDAAAKAIMRVAATIKRIAEKECNESLSAEDEQSALRARVRLTTLCTLLGVNFKVGGDPRGYTVKILFPKDKDGRRPYNTWGGEEEGYGVPTS